MLLETSSSQTGSGIRALLDRLLETAFEEGLVADGVIAETGAQGKELWRIREAIGSRGLRGGEHRVGDFLGGHQGREIGVRAGHGREQRGVDNP